MSIRMNTVSNRQIMDRFFSGKGPPRQPSKTTNEDNEKETKPVEGVARVKEAEQAAQNDDVQIIEDREGQGTRSERRAKEEAEATSEGSKETKQEGEPSIEESALDEAAAQPVIKARNLAIIRRIPSSMHSKHLRRYFADYVEDDKFACFHFRHRPETTAEERKEKDPEEPGPSSSTDESGKSNKKNKDLTTCCVVQLVTKQARADFIDDYHGRCWEDEQGLQLPRRCAVFPIKVADGEAEASSPDKLSSSDLAELIELRPPAAMPKGNVGTPSEYFMDQIRHCRLPTSLIGKLGLKGVRRKRKYERVHMEYAGNERMKARASMKDFLDDAARQEKEGLGAWSLQDDAPEDPTDRAMRDNFGPDNDDGDHGDEDQCEEWERHEALHDDVTEHERTKEKRFEEEMEVTWEKGGPGLVWEMDKAKWDEMEKGTDMDWMWADDWDVDYSVYYEGRSAGDVDSRAAVDMREDEARRKGDLVDSVFTKRGGRGGRRGTRGGRGGRERRNSDSNVDVEKYSKGVGSKIMRGMGWSSGKGLGRTEQGRIAPVSEHLDEDGQSGRDRTGFGFRGETMQRHGLQKRKEVHTIRSVFDDKEQKEELRTEQGEILFRRADKTSDNIRLVRSTYTNFAMPSGDL